MKELYKKKIILFLKKSGRKGIKHKELLEKCKVKSNNIGEWKDALAELLNEGIVLDRKYGYVYSESLGFFSATVARVNKTFGFINKNNEEKTEIFVPGKFLMGSMPGDIVLAKRIPSRNEGCIEGEVVKIVKQNKSQFSGTIVLDDGVIKLQPDSLVKTPLQIVKGGEFEVGDKVIAEIAIRGRRHSEHKARILESFGSAEKASSCAASILEVNGVSTEFPSDVLDEAKTISKMKITEKELEGRTDLRSEVIFTIDGEDTKDIDDAISVKKFDTFYELGVHIADVSHYVKLKTPLDKEAFDRGTSVYYANRVVPMLPKELSNGICSLNPQEDRLAFSCIMTIGLDGKLEDFNFKKTVIRSRVKGVYSEINQIINGTESKKIIEKYKECLDNIKVMKELADILTENKIKRGAPQIETSESKLIINEDDYCIDVKLRERGESELIIEEFMLMANQSAAMLGRLKGIPFVYRIHEDPSPEKVENLKQTLIKMGIDIPPFTNIKPMHLAKILDKTRGMDTFPVVNKLVLRSMAKAKYSVNPVGHFGLVLDDYAHFTSPIRRYPDLSIHRILSDVVAKVPDEVIKKKYEAFANKSATHSTDTELTAMTIERDCEDCYKAEYMKSHIGESFEGVISGATEHGIYVELANTVEGLIMIENIKGGPYDFDGNVSLRNAVTGISYTVGDKVKVSCTKANVSSGNIDFELV